MQIKKIIQLLLEHGAKLTHEDEYGYTPEDLANRHKNTTVASLLREFRNPSNNERSVKDFND